MLVTEADGTQCLVNDSLCQVFRDTFVILFDPKKGENEEEEKEGDDDVRQQEKREKVCR